MTDGPAMLIEDFKRRCEFIDRMTRDFVTVVPDNKWNFSPDPPTGAVRQHDPLRHGQGFAPFCKQLRHVICVRGVYNAAMITKKADFSKKYDHYTGSLTRDELLASLIEKQAETMATVETFDTTASIDFFGRAFSFGDLAFTIIQHEAIHHGQWSVYASLAGFETPLSWRSEWGL